MRRVGWIVAMTLAACSEPNWAPPPADAVAKCEYVQSLDFSRSALHFDARNRVIQADGLAYDEHDRKNYRASWTFEYDEQDRIVTGHSPYGTETFVWSDQQVDAMREWGNQRYQLVDGRVVRYESPMELPEAERNVFLLERDANGWITRSSGAKRYEDPGRPAVVVPYDIRYTYDEHGRVITIRSSTWAETTTTITYTETAGQLVVDMKTLEGLELTYPTFRWTFEYDDQRRITAYALEGEPPLIFTYGDGWFTVHRDDTSDGNYMLTATGQCVRSSDVERLGHRRPLQDRPPARHSDAVVALAVTPRPAAPPTPCCRRRS
jgi:hypothetical protein